MNNKIFSLILLSILSVFNVEAGIINKRSDPTVVRSIIWIDSDLYFENRDEITRYCTRFDVADLKFNDKYFICGINENYFTIKNKLVFYTNYQDDCIKGELVSNEFYYLNDVYEVPANVVKNCNTDIFENWHYYIVDKYDKINSKTVKALPSNASSASTTTTTAKFNLPPISMFITSKTLSITTSSPGNNYLPNVPITYPAKSIDKYITTSTSKTIPTTTSLPDAPPYNPNVNYLPNVPSTYSTKTIYITTTTSKTIPTTTSLPNVLSYITTTSKILPTTSDAGGLPNVSDFLNQSTVTVTVTDTPETVTVTVNNAPETVTVTVNNTPETVTITENNRITVTEKETETVVVTATVTSECLQPIKEPQQELNQTNIGPKDGDDEESSDDEGCVELYGQCGGVEYKGPTCCKVGRCTYFHQYYSQCIN